MRRALLLAAPIALAARLARDLRSSLGASSEELAASVAGSPNLHDGTFRNAEPSAVVGEDASWPAIVLGFLRRIVAGRPPFAIPVATPRFGPAADLAVTWLGHATVLLEIDGRRVLTDPMWSTYVSPTQLFGLRRLHPPPLPLASLPELDAIVISHDHFDHLDEQTARELSKVSSAPFLVPLGVGAHLRRWGVPPERVTELDWWQSTRLGDVEVTCTPARHYSGRTVLSNNTLWSSWAFRGPDHTAFFGGDTGPTTTHAEIADRLGRFDLTLLPIGAYDPSWPDIHLNPSQALAGHRQLAAAGAWLLPIHWATFPLAPHDWAEPIEWLLREADGDTPILTPPPGERLVPGATAPPDTTWWRNQPEVLDA